MKRSLSPQYLSALLTTCLMVTVVFKLQFWFLHPLLIWADQSVYMAMAQLLLQGKIPYLDFFDFNLPVIIYLNAIPMALAQWLQQPPPIVLDLCVLSLLAISLLLSNSVFRSSTSRIDYYTRLPWLFALAVFTQMQDADFAQREHLFVLLTAPYMLLRTLSPGFTRQPAKKPAPLLIGTLAAIGASIKPHFLALILAFEISAAIANGQEISIAALKKRFTRPEFKAFALTTLIYFAHFLLYPPQAWRIFLEEAMPIYYNGNSWFGHSLISSLADEEYHNYFFFALIAVTLLTISGKMRSRLTLPLLTFTWGAVIVFLITGGTWTYRLLPMQAGTLLLLSAEIGEKLASLRRIKLQGWRTYKTCGGIALAFATAVSTGALLHIYYVDAANAPPHAPIGSGYKYVSPLLDFSALYYSIIEHTNVNDPILYIGSGVRPGYPATLQSRRQPASRYLHGMIIPMLEQCIEKTHDNKYKVLLQRVLDQYGEDITKNKPVIVYLQIGLLDGDTEESFRTRYLRNYQKAGDLLSMGCAVYERQAGQADNAKRDLMIKVMLKQIRPEDAARQLNMTEAEFGRYLDQAEAALSKALFNTAAGGDEELYSKLNRCLEEKQIMQRTIDGLLEENIKLKAVSRASAGK
ncbi:MAG: hypothetical protein JSS86_03335 [Cyanobacteria bacterium SZAS LIN-2]|nr:hypothetical protein [Cyanobacteria bacterium SZAS LIN-2]